MERTLDKYERIKKIPGYDGDYCITSKGRVWSYKRSIWLKPSVSEYGYEVVVLSFPGKKAKNMKIHKLVADAFIKNPYRKPWVNHKNGKKGDNRACNLEWVTPRENIQHAADKGLNKVFKLKQPQKEMIVQLHKLLGYKKRQLASIFGVSYSAIYYLVKNYTIIEYY